MSREILFKGKRKDNGEWVEGFYVMYSTSIEYPYSYTNGKHCIQTVPHNIQYEVDPETVCQYIGLTDKNGKKIWENDIVSCGGKLVVTWKENLASFCLSKKGWMYQHFFGEAVTVDVEVIGNIFDNQELLKGMGEKMNDDLISREEAINGLRKCTQLGRKSCEQVVEMLKVLPPAYDVGEVVEAMEADKEELKRIIENGASDVYKNTNYGFFVAMNRAIDIVKAGGVNET